jgi:hypothetical protein
MRRTWLFFPAILVACAAKVPGALHGPAADAPPACVGSDLRSFSAPADPGVNGVLVTVSGEALAVAGYPFTQGSSTSQAPAFVDGWAVTFEHILVSIDRVTLSNNPDGDPNDQRLTGDAVRTATGPWAYDLVHPSPRAITGRGGTPERADPLVAFEGLDAETKYALSFETVPAQSCAVDVNLDDTSRALFGEMIAAGHSILFVGTATYLGGPACTAAGGHDFSKLPGAVRFKLGFASPTAYVNCQNPDLQGPPDNAFEEAPRGVQASQSGAAVAQLTFHTDHLFWDRLTHDRPLHFDPFAASAHEDASGAFVLASADLARADYNGFRTRDGAALAPRACVTDFTPGPGGQLRFDPAGVAPLPTFLDYVKYSQSTMGHLNADGLCAVVRRYPSPL